MDSAPQKSKASAMAFLVGGLLPVVAFTAVERYYGPVGGAIAGIVFGTGEISWELWRYGTVQKITWLSSALVLVFSLLSLWEDNGVLFKLQPAALVLIFALLLLLSAWMKKPFLTAMAKKQNPALSPAAEALLSGVNLRLGFFFLFLTAVSVHAALYWSTIAWATLKGLGMPILLGAYMVGEFVWARFTRGRKQ